MVDGSMMLVFDDSMNLLINPLRARRNVTKVRNKDNHYTSATTATIALILSVGRERLIATDENTTTYPSIYPSIYLSIHLSIY